MKLFLAKIINENLIFLYDFKPWSNENCMYIYLGENEKFIEINLNDL